MALYLYNCSEYLEATFACFKIGLVPINTNYRYADDELVYLWENADTVAVVFHGAFVDRIEGIRDRVPAVRAWLWVDDGTAPCPAWAVPYEGAAAAAGAGADRSTGRVRAPWGRSPDDIYMLYTGGTTGMPKGVMWRQDDLFARLNSAGFRRYPEDGGRRRRPGRAGAQRTGHDPAAGLPAHARHRWVHLDRVPQRGRPGGDPHLPAVRSDRAARHGRAGEGQRADHRGRRLRQAHPGRAGRPPRTAGT